MKTIKILLGVVLLTILFSSSFVQAQHYSAPNIPTRITRYRPLQQRNIHRMSVGNLILENQENKEDRPTSSENTITIPVVSYEQIIFQDYIERLKEVKNNFRTAVIAGTYNALSTAEGEQAQQLKEALDYLTSLNPEDWEKAGELLSEFDFYQNLLQEYESQIREIAQLAYDSAPQLSIRSTLKELIKNYIFPYIHIPGVASGYAGIARGNFITLFQEFRNRNLGDRNIRSFGEFYELLPDWIKNPWAEVLTEPVNYGGEFHPVFRPPSRQN